MFDEPSEGAGERAFDPEGRAREKFEEFRMHAELAAVFEGPRKFEARIVSGLDGELAREIQKTCGRLEKSRPAGKAVVGLEMFGDAAGLLKIPETKGLATNDYHIHRRPGEVIIVRWLEGDQVEGFYERMQAHFDAALNQFREEERQSRGWKQDPKTLAYLAALDKGDLRMAEIYLRDLIRKHNAFMLSTQTADEIDILHLADYVMGVEPAEVVGAASAPPEEPTEAERAWFFKLYSVRGMDGAVERMCFFAFLQKSDEGEW
jgi:hypothetical protein